MIKEKRTERHNLKYISWNENSKNLVTKATHSLGGIVVILTKILKINKMDPKVTDWLYLRYFGLRKMKTKLSAMKISKKGRHGQSNIRSTIRLTIRL